MESNLTTMSSADKEIKAIASPYNTRSKAMKSTSDKKGNKLSQSTLLPPSAFLPKKSKKEETYKKDESSDDDDNSEACDDDDSDDYITDSEESDDDAEYITDSEDNDDDPDFEKFIGNDKEFNKLADKEYKKFLAELFPSKYMKRRLEEVEEYSSDEDDEPEPPKKSRKKISARECPPAPKKPRTKYIQSQEELDIINKYEKKHNCQLKRDSKSKGRFIDSFPELSKYNISFIIGGENNEDDENVEYMSDTEALYDESYDDSDDDTEDDSENEDEEEEKNSVKNKDVDCIMTEIGQDNKINITQEKQNSSKKNKKSSPLADKDETEAFTKIKDLFKGLSKEEQENPTIKKVIDDINSKEEYSLKRQERQEKKNKVKNTKKLKKLLKERDVMNDLQYFNEKMSIKEQEHALEQFELIKQHSDITKPYRLTLLESNIPPQYKASAYRKISTLKHMEPGGSEYFKMKNWVDTFMRIPFNQYKNLPISLEADGVDKCHEFMENAKKTLDEAVYGLEDAKLQIMQMIGQWIVNPSAIGTAIAIKGPMGTGKTTLVKEGISKILGRDFAFIALGGATDSSFLEGHSYTYEGSTWGKIVDLLIRCKSINPVIYFDELDKISDTPKGEEIAGILTHLTDTTQNSEFHDKYFSEIDFDLSRCLFIFSYNDESKVNRILLDRMYRIQTKGYEQQQKTIIANKYLLPKICDQVKFNIDDITVSDDTMNYIISNYTEKEDGVRTLKRCLEIVYTKLNLYRLMKPDTNLFENEMSVKVQFPMTVTPQVVDALIKKNTEKGSWQNMYS